MYRKEEREKKKEKKKVRLRRDSNPQSSDPKSDALSIRPRSQLDSDCLNKLLKRQNITTFKIWDYIAAHSWNAKLEIYSYPYIEGFEICLSPIPRSVQSGISLV